MSAVKYIGRSAGIYYGKTLFEIVCQLKNFGVGRVVIRESFYNRYAEPSYHIITRASPDMTDETLRKGKVWGIKVFRGVRFAEEVGINSGYKPDWKLIPKDQVDSICNFEGQFRERKVIPGKSELPPVLDMFMKQKYNTPCDLDLKIQDTDFQHYVSEDKLGTEEERKIMYVRSFQEALGDYFEKQKMES